MKSFNPPQRREDRGIRASSTVVALAIAVVGFGAVTQAAAQTQAAHDDLAQYCLATADPIPSGVTQRPNANFTTWPDYNFVHSSTHLQGKRATEKFAPGLFWFPPAPAELSGLRSSVVVTNPDPVLSANVLIEYFDEAGTPLSTSSFTLGPEQFHAEGAQPVSFGNGRGAARIRTTNGVPIVGATVHHTLSFDLSGFGGGVVTDPDPFNPGATSMQQLQVAQQNKTTLYLGPLPTSDQSNLDFLNGNSPLIWVMNPSATQNANVSVLYLSRRGLIFTNSAVIPPLGTHLDLTLWNLALPFYLSGPVNYDDDFLVLVSSDQPVVGEALMVDLFGNSPGNNLVLGGRFRMGSAMLANTLAGRVVNPELTYQPTTIGVHTIMGILNASNLNIGPVAIRYYNRNGGVIGNDTINPFPSGTMARIGPGQAASPNYPTNPVFDGWVRITACKPGLVGWTMRASGDEPGVVTPYFRKVWGEVLSGSNGQEPGNGFQVTVGSSPWKRKVMPLVRVDPSFYWPGYTAMVNNSTANVGTYWFRYYNAAGTNVTLIPPVPPQPYAGLRFANTSFTFDDPLVDPSLVPFVQTITGRTDITQGTVQGIDVIGDPMAEWDIFAPFDN